MKRMIRKIYYFIKIMVFNFIFELEWIISYNRILKRCTDEKSNVIVSLTSFPERIKYVHKTIISILNQKKYKPKEIELWLAKEQFPKLEKSLPIELLKLKKMGLKVLWCDDIKSYKKLIPAIINNIDNVIVTADDDVLYNRNWLEKLVVSYNKNPNNIYCHRITKVIIENNQYSFIPGGKHYYKEPAFLNKLVGIGGVLYPPKSLYKDILDDEKFMKLAPTNDDLWFWIMAVLNGTKIACVDENEYNPISIIGVEKTTKLTDVNDKKDNLLMKQFNNLLEYYPELVTIFAKEISIKRGEY